MKQSEFFGESSLEGEDNKRQATVRPPEGAVLAHRGPRSQQPPCGQPRALSARPADDARPAVCATCRSRRVAAR